MLTQAIWWSSDALIFYLIMRAVAKHFVQKYPVFYIYLSYVLLVDLIRFFYYTFEPPLFRSIYWYTEFVTVALGYCVIWEIYQRALAAYPGTLRMASRLIWALFIIVLGKAVFNAFARPGWEVAATVGELERNLRAVQAVLLLIGLGVLAYYMVPIGRNLRGIILGYGFFIGVGVINTTLRSRLGEHFQVWWQYFQSSSYLITLLIWCATLWSYRPNPTPEVEREIERDYEMLSSRTSLAVNKARDYILKGVR